MNAITPTNAKPPAKMASALTTPGLWRRLTDESVPWADAIRALAADPLATDELAIVVWDLECTVEPCGPAVVLQTLAPLLALYGLGRKSEAEAEAFWGFYYDALSGLPAEALRKGVGEYVADPKSEFFPKPGPLKGVCERHAVPLRMAANRARKALDHHTFHNKNKDNPASIGYR